MSDAVASLAAAGEQLVHALDCGDAAGIEQANRRLADAAATVAAAGAWTASAELREQLRTVRARLDAARARVNYLADRTTRRLDRLAALTGAPRTAAYGRRGYLR